MWSNMPGTFANLPAGHKTNMSSETTLIDSLEGLEPLDGIGKQFGKGVRGLFGQGAVKDGLSGRWLGHALHPLLTDVVIGSFVSATLLDLLGGDDDGRASERLIAVGLAAYGPTAAAGFNDWADTEPVSPAVRRVGLIHAWTNLAAFTLYSGSLAARRKGARGRGKLLAAAGAGVLAGAGYLGGHLSFTRGVGPNQTVFDRGPDDWTPAIASSELPNGEPTRVVVGDTPVLLLRHGDHFHGIHDRCSHRGCSLADGELEKETITCACHGSKFSLRDGSVLQGPATAPQPAFDVRESGGQVEVKLADA
jgi:nitrite reductase/ring-hydroxylating ferredoxin subunit